MQVETGKKLRLTISGVEDLSVIGCPDPVRFQVTIIDPSDGTRVLGPKTISIDPFVVDSFSQAIWLGPISAAFTDKLLAVGIIAVNSGWNVVGSTGWVFVVVP